MPLRTRTWFVDSNGGIATTTFSRYWTDGYSELQYALRLLLKRKSYREVLSWPQFTRLADRGGCDVRTMASALKIVR